MDAAFRIRSAVPADAASLVAIERRCFSDPWSEAAFREALSSEWSFGLVAEGARGAGGYLVGREVGGSGEILNLAVAPEFRRRGLGRALLERLAREAATLGCDQLHLDSGVGPERESAHRLYFGARMRIASYHFTRVL